MKKVAIVGFGFMGRTHYGAWKRCRGAKAVAVCVTDLTHLKRKVVAAELAAKSGYEAEVEQFLAQVEGQPVSVPFAAADARGSVALIECERRSISAGKAVNVR